MFRTARITFTGSPAKMPPHGWLVNAEAFGGIMRPATEDEAQKSAAVERHDNPLGEFELEGRRVFVMPAVP